MDNRYAKVEGSSTLIRDMQTGAILNTDDGGYKAYIAQRDAAIRKRNEMNVLKDEVSSLKEDMSEIKQLLKQLLTTK